MGTSATHAPTGQRDTETDMVFKLRSRLMGKHVHEQIFAGEDVDHLVLAGELVFNVGEWQLFDTTLMLGAEKIGRIVKVMLEGDEEVIDALQKMDEEV